MNRKIDSCFECQIVIKVTSRLHLRNRMLKVHRCVYLFLAVGNCFQAVCGEGKDTKGQTMCIIYITPVYAMTACDRYSNSIFFKSYPS